MQLAAGRPEMKPRYTVLIVDDHPLMRKGVAQLLELSDEFLVAGEASSGKEALRQAAELQPDMILLDLNMKQMNGLDTLRALRQQGCASQVIVLSVSDAYEDVIAMLKAGANGYLLKDMEPDNLINSLRSAATGEQVLSRAIAGYLLEEPRQEVSQKQQMFEKITRREREILNLIAEGKSNRGIADSLHISEGTVKVHVKSLLKKLGMRSRVEAAVWFLS
jgi:DNA-binding NarL/FixJ family response regulator